MTANIGAPLDRVDGRLKDTGAAKYSAEWPMPGVAHGFMVLSTIANGRIRDIDATRALRSTLHGFVTLELAGDFALPVDVDRSFARLIRGLVTALANWTDQPTTTQRQL